MYPKKFLCLAPCCRRCCLSPQVDHGQRARSIAPFGGHLWYCNAVFAQWGQASWNFFGLLLGTSASFKHRNKHLKTMIIFIRSSRKNIIPTTPPPPPPQKKDLIPTHVITSCNHYGQWKFGSRFGQWVVPPPLMTLRSLRPWWTLYYLNFLKSWTRSRAASSSVEICLGKTSTTKCLHLSLGFGFFGRSFGWIIRMTIFGCLV